MIIPHSCCQPDDHSCHCPAVAETRPSNITQLDYENDYEQRYASYGRHVAVEILSRHDEHGKPLFPLLSKHVTP